MGAIATVILMFASGETAEQRGTRNRSILEARMKVFIGSVLVMLFAVVGEASAGQFDVVGAGCVPDNTAIQGELYANNSGGTGHASGKVSTVTLHCPITNASTLNVFGVKTLRILYTDSTSLIGNSVIVTLYKISNATGALSIVSQVNTDGCFQGGTSVCASSFTEVIDSANNFYFLGVYIQRTFPSATETFWGASVF
jgi:hypothetical protein